MSVAIIVAGTVCPQVESEDPNVDVYMGDPEGEDLVQVARHDRKRDVWTVALFFVPTTGALRFSVVARATGRTKPEAEDRMVRQMAERIRSAA